MGTFKSSRISWFQVFKYTIYTLLGYNFVQFFLIDYKTSMVSGGLGLAAFAASTDAFAWLVLLIMFELETYVLSDALLNKLKWLFKIVFLLCCVVLLYTFSGFVSKYLWTLDFIPVTGTPPVTDFVGYSWMQELDDFVVITQNNAGSLATSELFINTDDAIVTDGNALNYTRNQSLADVFNAGAWLLVLCLLEMDVLLQLRDRFKGPVKMVSNTLKIIGYAVLLAAAGFWGYNGLLLDFWDAFLWIVAFVFIEMNIVKGQDKPHEPATVALQKAQQRTS